MASFWGEGQPEMASPKLFTDMLSNSVLSCVSFPFLLCFFDLFLGHTGQCPGITPGKAPGLCVVRGSEPRSSAGPARAFPCTISHYHICLSHSSSSKYLQDTPTLALGWRLVPSVKCPTGSSLGGLREPPELQPIASTAGSERPWRRTVLPQSTRNSAS